MALQITDLVSKEALNQLSRLNTELEKVKATFESVAQNMAINVNVNVQGREDLANLTKVITTNFNALNNATKKAEEEQNKFSAAVGQEVKTIKEAQQYNKKLREERNKTNVTTKDGKKHVEELNKQIDKNTKLIKDNTDAYSKLKMGIGKYFESFTKANLLTMGIQKAGEILQAAFQKVQQVIVETFQHAAKVIIQFEADLSKLKAITGATTVEMAKMTAQALYLGQTTRYTASEIVGLQTELAKLGFKSDDILGMTKAVEEFGLATGGSMADSAALAGAMLRTFGGRADETTRYLSTLAKATTNSALSFGYLETALPIVAGGAATMGWSIEDVTALLGKMADSGMSASIAATALRNIFLHLSDTNSKMYAQFGKVESLDQFLAKLKEMQDAGANLGDILEMTDKRASVPFANLVRHAEDVDKLRQTISNCDEELHNIANTMNDNVQGSIFALKSAWESVELAFLSSKSTMKDVLDYVVQIVRQVATFLADVETLKGMAGAGAADRVNQDLNESKDGKLSKTQQTWEDTQKLYLKYRKEGLSVEEAQKKAIDAIESSLKNEIKGWKKQAKEYKKAVEEAENINDSFLNSAWAKAGMVAVELKSLNFVGVYNTLYKSTATIKEGVKMLSEEQQYYEGLAAQRAKTFDEMRKADFGMLYDKTNTFEAKETNKERELRLQKEKQAREKLQKEIDKLNQISAQAEIALTMETETKKEISIRAKYTKYLAEIANMEYVSTEQRLAVISKLELAQIAELEKNKQTFVEKRAVENAKNWSVVYYKNMSKAYEAELNLINVQHLKELNAAKELSLDLVAVNAKYEAMQLDLFDKYETYKSKVEQTNIKNKLEYIQLGTEEEFALRKKLLDLEYEEELKNAEKTGADMEAIRKKYANKVATAEIGQKNNRLSETTIRIDTEQSNAQSELMEAFRKGGMDETTYNLRSEQNARKYAVARLQATIDTMEEELKIADLTTDQEAELYNKIAKAREELNKTLLDSDKATFKAMIDNVEKWASAAQEAFSAIAGFMSQNYEIEIDQLDDEKDKLDEKYDADVERIERLEDQGAISSEEAEARKRAAKDQTEQKQKEISKKQQELAYKQAVWDKAASASQTAISTALGIMKVWAAEGTNASKVVMSALVAAQGAMQLATILATPIPKYAKGTEGHKGGLAVVGDGGRSEFVVMGAQGWVTPSTSTLVDLPKGAQVFPDAKSVMMTLPVYNESGKQVKVVNDYKELERKQKTANGLLKVIAANTRGNSNYNQYKRTIW